MNKKIFILTITFLILVGLTTITATDTNDTTTITDTTQTNTIDTTTETNTKNYDTTSTNEASTSQTDNIQENTDSQGTLNNKTEEKTQNLKADRNVIVNSYTELNSYLTNNTYDTVTIEIDKDIQLVGSIKVNNAIINLTINGNGKTINGYNKYRFLYMNHAINVTINNLTITQCNSSELGGAIYVGSNSNLTVTNINFTNNYVRNTSNYRTFIGGAIGGSTKTIITVTNSNFRSNTAFYGGAIYGGNNSNITVTNSNLTSNTAFYGGAIYGGNNSNITVINSNLTSNNVANTNSGGDPDYGGGAIYGSYSNITVINSVLTHNNAIGFYRYGGAISGLYSNITVTNNNFTNNTADDGGAISGTYSNITVTNNNFTNNTAITNGGAIFAFTNSFLTVTNSIFTNNKVSSNHHGGAISGGANSYIIVANTNLTNNNAGAGGAIAGHRGSILTVTYSNLTNNNANSGGAIYGNINSTLIVTNTNITYNNANTSGGAIYGYDKNSITVQNSNLINNNAKEGGAIRGNHANITVINTNISYNNASNGGAIYGSTNSNITIDNNNITHNNATQRGGAIYGRDNNIITVQNSNLINNNATLDGGAIYGNSKSIITVTNSTISNNIANSLGAGAIYGYSNSNITVTNSNLTYNIANSGGAINCHSNSNITITNSNLSHNNANTSGGAIYTNTYNNMTITNTSLTYNNANTSGGAIHGQRFNNITLTNTNCTHNNVNISGGVIHGQNNNLTIINTNLTHNNAPNSGGAICEFGNITLKNSIIIDNYVQNEGYVIDFNYANSIIITDNKFINNTDNVRDMLFSNAKISANVDVHGNSYIDNFLEVSIIKPNVTVVTDDEFKSYDYYVDLKLRNIYNDTVHNGTLNVYVNGDLKDTTEVVNGRARIIFENSDLTKRENNITLEYISQSKHYQNTSTTFTLKKEINTTLTIQAPNKMNAGDVTVINFTLKDVNNTPLSGETIHVLVDEEQVATITTDENGVANYTFNASGDELVRIEAAHHTSSDSFYLSSKDAVAEIDVNKIEPELVIVPGNIIPHLESNITIHLFDNDGNPIKNKTLTVNITEEGKPNITGTVTTDENGIAIFNFTPTDEGTLNINVTSPSDDIYHYASESIQVNKNVITTNLIVTASSMKINQTNTIRVEVSADGALLSGTVEMDIDGEIHILNINNGHGAYYDYKSATAVEKLVTAKFISNNPSYGNATTTEEFNVEKLPTNVTIEAVNLTARNVTLKVLVFPENNTGSTVNGGNIVIKSVDGENRKVIYNNTLQNGELVYLTDINKTGWYEFEAEYHGNDYFLGELNNTGSIEVTPRESQSTGTITNNTIGNVTIDVQVVDSETGEPVTGPVNIIIDDEIVGTGDLNEEGRATIPLDIDKKGNYTIVVEYEGNDDYKGSTDTLEDINIVCKDVNITTNIDNPTVGNTTVNVTITDPETDEPIPNAIVIITLPNGTNVTETTDENGTVTIPIDVPSGDNNLTITYPGDDEHEPQQKNITIRVKSYTIVTVDPVEGVALDNVTFTANVGDYQDNPVTGGYVQFNVGGKTLKDENGKNIRVLVENGIAKLSYQAESGWIVDSHPDLKVQAVYTGTSLVKENRSDTNKVTIYKRNATVTVSAPDDYVNGTLHIDAAVRDQNGSLINDGYLVFKLNGLSLKDENNKGIVAQVSDGKVHVDVKLPFAYSSKKYNLTATYSHKIYNKATVTNTTTLKAIPTYVNATVTIKDQFSKPVVTGQIYNKFNNAILEGTAIINIKFDGISYAKKVKVNNGTFTETLEGIPIYKPGTHKVEVVAGANSHYDAVRKIITTKATPKYNVNTEFINITRNKTTTRVQAKIVDDKNKNVQRDLSITIKLNGKSFLVNRTVTNGIVDVLVDTSTLKNRIYNLELVSGANTYYNAGSAKTKLPKY